MHLFGALEIDCSDVPKLFEMLDSGNGTVNREEFIRGLKKLRGAAHSIDMITVMRDCRMIRMFLDNMVCPLDMDTKGGKVQSPSTAAESFSL